MSIFESLESLNISEECFNTIFEDIVKSLKKKAEEAIRNHEIENSIGSARKADKALNLLNQARKNRNMEFNRAVVRDSNIISPEIANQYSAKGDKEVASYRRMIEKRGSNPNTDR